MEVCFSKQLYFLCFVFFSLFLMSCLSGKKERFTGTENSAKEGLYRLREKALKLSSTEQVDFWKKRLQDKKYNQIPESRARIYYWMAGIYYNKGDQDSLKFYMQKAWDVLEGEEINSDLEVLLNYGEGNIATIEGNIHQENYYFNLAAQGIVADPLIDLTPTQKAMIFMATAQSDAGLSQLSQAMDWNKRAIQVLSYDKAPVEHQYRAYRQLATNFRDSFKGNLDSANYYIQKIESIWRQHPTEINPRFLYDEKAHYFEHLQKYDSAIVYHQKNLQLDLEMLEQQPQYPSSHSNLFKDYINLSQNYLQLNNIAEAKRFIQKAEEFTKKDQKFLSDADHLLFQEASLDYYLHTRQFEKATEGYDLLLEKNRAVYENKYAQSIAEMATIYKLQTNDKHIMRLNQQVLMTENKLARNKLLLIISALSALLAIAIGVILYIGRKQLKLKEEKEKVQLQKRAMELQQQLLRTQMEPHFIFNTLAALQGYIRVEEKDKALRYLNQFSHLLRNSLELSRENYVGLEEEIKTLEYYLALQQMRYDESFDYEIKKSYPEEDYQILIPPMLIQPFVENAILHGVSKASGRGKISVDLRLDNDSLFVKIIDNGSGINALKQESDGNKKSLSTTISRERLEILAKEKGVKVQVNIFDRNEINKTLTGTLVELIIPIEKHF